MVRSAGGAWPNGRRLQEGCAQRVAIVGVGHELRGDDAAGLAVVSHLAGRLAAAGRNWAGERLLVVHGGPAPENVTGLLREFGPDLVLLVDAAELDAEPGAVRWLPSDVIEGLSATTHTMPLSMLARYLQHELDCDVYLIGIQPGQNGIGQPLSAAVVQAVGAVSEGLQAVFA